MTKHQKVVPGDRRTTLQMINFALSIPGIITTSDDRELRVKSWSANMVVGKEIEIAAVFVPCIDYESFPLPAEPTP